MRDSFDKNYDLITCRNVVIYFTDEAKVALYQRFREALNRNGMLFVGTTEHIFANEIGFQGVFSFFYRRFV